MLSASKCGLPSSKSLGVAELRLESPAIADCWIFPGLCCPPQAYAPLVAALHRRGLSAAILTRDSHRSGSLVGVGDVVLNAFRYDAARRDAPILIGHSLGALVSLALLRYIPVELICLLAPLPTSQLGVLAGLKLTLRYGRMFGPRWFERPIWTPSTYSLIDQQSIGETSPSPPAMESGRLLRELTEDSVLCPGPLVERGDTKFMMVTGAGDPWLSGPQARAMARALRAEHVRLSDAAHGLVGDRRALVEVGEWIAANGRARELGPPQSMGLKTRLPITNDGAQKVSSWIDTVPVPLDGVQELLGREGYVQNEPVKKVA